MIMFLCFSTISWVGRLPSGKLPITYEGDPRDLFRPCLENSIARQKTKKNETIGGCLAMA